jgi:hypothetical protein
VRVQVRIVPGGGNAAETFLAGERDREAVPLFTYHSPVRRWGLIFVGAGAFFIFAALLLFIQGILAAAMGPNAGVGALFDAFWPPLVLGAIGAALVVGGGTGLFVSWFGPSSLDDYEGPGDAPIWGRCPRCGSKNGRGASQCAQCGRPLYPSQHGRWLP